MTGVVLQARMGSTRLPGKVLMDLEGKPVIQRVLERVGQAKAVAKIVVAIPATSENHELARTVTSLGYKCQFGSEDDVLDRYHWVATLEQLDPIVRITADCPLIDPEIITQVIRTFQRGHYDYVSNVHPPTFPDGLDVEVFSFKALDRAWREAKELPDREHVTPYIWRFPSPFTKQNVWNERDLSNLRWTLDTAEDLAYIRSVYKHFRERPFYMHDILRLGDTPHTMERVIRL